MHIVPNSGPSAARAERPAPVVAQRTKIAIGDKNPVVRAGLADFMARDGRFEVVGSVANGSAFLSLVVEKTVDIGIIGWALPDMTGGDVLQSLKRRQSQTRVIVYTGEPGTEPLRQSIKSGAWGYISKSDEPSVLLDTIATVSRGRLCFPYVDIQSLSQDPLETLTARERELLVALANGWTNMQIAARTGISSNTVKYHLKNLYDKLAVNNRAMAVALYMSSSRDGR